MNTLSGTPTMPETRDCPVCFLPCGADEDLMWCQSHCKKPFHAECVKAWLPKRCTCLGLLCNFTYDTPDYRAPDERRDHTCPNCRGPFYGTVEDILRRWREVFASPGFQAEAQKHFDATELLAGGLTVGAPPLTHHGRHHDEQWMAYERLKREMRDVLMQTNRLGVAVNWYQLINRWYTECWLPTRAEGDVLLSRRAFEMFYAYVHSNNDLRRFKFDRVLYLARSQYADLNSIIHLSRGKHWDEWRKYVAGGQDIEYQTWVKNYLHGGTGH